MSIQLIHSDTPAPKSKLLESSLADSTVLVRLRTGRPTLSRSDEALASQIRSSERDDSITLHRHLFKGKNLVREAVSCINHAYSQHKKMTVPWVDNGPRLLRADKVSEYEAMVHAAIEKLKPIAAEVQRTWPQLVQADIAQRGGGASVTDYQDQSEVADLFTLAYSVRPVPTAGDFRVAMTDAQKEMYRRELEEAQNLVKLNLLGDMLKPISDAAAKLAVPIGEEGAVFRDSLVGNLKAVAAKATEYNLSDDATITRMVAEINSVLDGFNASPEILRHSQGARSRAAEQLADLAARFGA